MTVLSFLCPTIPSVLVQYVLAKTHSFFPCHLWAGIIQLRHIFPRPPNEVLIPLYYHQLPFPTFSEELRKEGVRVLPVWLALICCSSVPGMLGGAALILFFKFLMRSWLTGNTSLSGAVRRNGFAAPDCLQVAGTEDSVQAPPKWMSVYKVPPVGRDSATSPAATAPLWTSCSVSKKRRA